MRVFLLLLFGFQFVAAQEEALNYMKSIEADNQKIMGETWNYMQSIARSKSVLLVESQRQRLAKSIEEALNHVKSQPDFNGDTAYRDSSIEYLQFNLDVISGRTDELVDLEKIAYQSFDGMEAYINYQEELNLLIQEQNKMVQQAQKQFAERNNIDLILQESELTKKIKTGSQVLDNKNDYFLAFYRCASFENELLDKLKQDNEAANLVAAETMLLEYVRESRTQLENIDAYGNDHALEMATQEALDFFEKEATELFLPLAEFREKRLAFDKQTQRLQNLKPEERTKEVVEKYNQMVDEMNQQAQTINQLNQQYNQLRSKMYREWNTSADAFVEKHMPQD